MCEFTRSEITRLANYLNKESENLMTAAKVLRDQRNGGAARLTAMKAEELAMYASRLHSAVANGAKRIVITE